MQNVIRVSLGHVWLSAFFMIWAMGGHLILCENLNGLPAAMISSKTNWETALIARLKHNLQPHVKPPEQA